MKITTTVCFDPSPDAINDYNAGKPGVYRARVFIQDPSTGQQQELPTMEFPATQSSFDMVAEEGLVMIAALAYVDARGVRSPATPIQFTVSKDCPPQRPTNLRVSSVKVPVSLPVLGEAPADSAKDDGYRLSVEDHPDLIDGALGRITAVFEDQVEASFDQSSYRDPANAGVFGPAARYECQVVGDPCKYMVITPDQQTITLKQYIDDHFEAKRVETLQHVV